MKPNATNDLQSILDTLTDELHRAPDEDAMVRCVAEHLRGDPRHDRAVLAHARHVWLCMDGEESTRPHLPGGGLDMEEIEGLEI